MREIKFRAWDKKSKKIRQVHYLVFNNHGYDSDNSKLKIINCWGYNIINQKEIIVQREPKEVDLMQYTGLKDKNGTEIYEGDIVSNKTKTLGRLRKGSKGEVYFNKKLCRFSVFIGYPPKNGSHDSLLLTENHAKHLEIVGNIYEK